MYSMHSCPIYRGFRDETETASQYGVPEMETVEANEEDQTTGYSSPYPCRTSKSKSHSPTSIRASGTAFGEMGSHSWYGTGGYLYAWFYNQPRVF